MCRIKQRVSLRGLAGGSLDGQPASAGDASAILGRRPLRREWQPAPVLLPGESCGQEPAGYRPWGHKEMDTTRSHRDGIDRSE